MSVSWAAQRKARDRQPPRSAKPKTPARVLGLGSKGYRPRRVSRSVQLTLGRVGRQCSNLSQRNRSPTGFQGFTGSVSLASSLALPFAAWRSRAAVSSF